MKTFLLPITLLATTFASATQAQDFARNFSFGNSDFGANMRFSAGGSASETATRKSAEIHAAGSASVRLFGNTLPGFEAEGQLEGSLEQITLRTRLGARSFMRASGSASGLVRIAGTTVWQGSASHTVDLRPTLPILDVSRSGGIRVSRNVGPFTLSFTARASVDLDVAIAPDLSFTQIGVGLVAGADLAGRVQVSAVAGGFGARLTARMRAQPVAEAEGHYVWGSGLGASLSYGHEALRFVLTGTVLTPVANFPFTIFEWSRAATARRYTWGA